MEDQASFNPLAVAMLMVTAYLTWSLPRRFAICPLLVMTCLMPLGQDLELFGLHFHLFRILLLIGMVRVVAKGEAARLKFAHMDKLFIWWIMISVLFGTMSKPSVELLVNRFGDAYNAAGCYFFVRCIIVSFEDIVTSICTLALVSMPVAAFMLVEKTTAHNLLSVFGGVPEITAVRDGHLRCQGAFRHPILAGVYGATQIPFFIALWFYQPQSRRLAIAALVSSLIIVITASSSGALMALFAGGCGMVMWKHRKYMRLIRRLTVVTILMLALIMNAPVWYLIAKLSDLTGGGGWHRAYLIDQAVAHFDEWWLFGTTYTAHWGPAGEVIAADPNMMDITNRYIMEGVKGGMLKLIFFVAIIVGCFKIVGRRIRTEALGNPNRLLIWAMGVSLFAHCLSFLSVDYFDQIIVLWYWLLGVIVCIGCISDKKPPPLGTEESEAENTLFESSKFQNQFSGNAIDVPTSRDQTTACEMLVLNGKASIKAGRLMLPENIYVC
ncbi:MAG: hypothetical protein PHY43_12630 [Verrucomicrobiales bacterium]|nr:hypothetical protein [Verrucomicrobiales bacterium]